MREVDGLVLSPGHVRQLAFPYREFDPNAEIDVFVQRAAESKSVLPAGDVQGDVDIFPSFAMGDHPVDLIPGSPAYKDVTRRTPQLDSLLQLRGASYPPNDQEFPQWAKERDAQLFPRSHSK